MKGMYGVFLADWLSVFPAEQVSWLIGGMGDGGCVMGRGKQPRCALGRARERDEGPSWRGRVASGGGRC